MTYPSKCGGRVSNHDMKFVETLFLFDHPFYQQIYDVAVDRVDHIFIQSHWVDSHQPEILGPKTQSSRSGLLNSCSRSMQAEQREQNGNTWRSPGKGIVQIGTATATSEMSEWWVTKVVKSSIFATLDIKTTQSTNPRLGSFSSWISIWYPWTSM